MDGIEEIKKVIGNLEILDKNQTNKIEQEIFSRVKFDSHGVSWTKYPESLVLGDIREIAPQIDGRCFIMWDEGTLPIIKVDFKSIVENVRTVTRIAFDTWIVGENFDWIIEFHHTDLVHYTRLP